MMPAGSINAWECDRCGTYLVAVHRDSGVTPMFLACREPGCGGRAVSLGYPPPPVPAGITEALAWEWRTASRSEMKRWRRDRDPMYQHCEQGGLILQPIGAA